MSDLKFEILNYIGVVSEGKKKWKKELNIVSWNGNEPKYDLREWSSDHTKMGKGVTLTKDELRQLSKIIEQELDELEKSENAV